MIEIPLGMLIGFLLWFFLRYGFGGFYTVGPSERAVLTSFGRAARIPGQTTLNDPVSGTLRADERDRSAHNQVSSEISLAQAAADQKLVMSRRAVEIETLNAQAEVEPLLTLAAQLTDLANQGPEALRAYLRNAGPGLLRKTRQLVLSRDFKEAP